MKKIYSLVFLTFLSILGINAQNSITSVDQTYSQNFNTLADTGTTYDLSLPNWAISTDTYRVSDGTANNGTVYSFGATASTERALGAITSSSTSNISFGTSFKNETDKTIGTVEASFNGEQWRRSNKTLNGEFVGDTLVFQYSKNASSATDASANWVTVSALQFVSPNTTDGTSNGIPLDGNSAENSKAISGSFEANVAPGQTLTIRWNYIRNSGNGLQGSRDGIAIDDLSLTFREGEDVPVDECDFDYYASPNITTFSNDLESFELTFKPVEGAAGYVIVLNDIYETESYDPFILEDGVVYEEGDYFDGYEILAITNITDFDYDLLYEESEYYVYIYPYFECDGEITYGSFDDHYFITAEACDVAESLETNFVTSTIGSTSASFELMPVEGASGYIVFLDAIGDNEDYDGYGEPVANTEYEVGDKINESLIVHIGTSTSFTVSDLNPEFYYEIYAHPYFECGDDLLYGWYNGTAFITTSVPTAIKNNVSKDMLIYPNPVAGNVINVRLDASVQGKANLQIFNVLGAQVYAAQTTLSSENQIVLPSRLPAGRYSIRIEQDGQTRVGSFIVIQ